METSEIIALKKIIVLYHMYYEDTCEYIINELDGLKNLNVIFLFNISSDMPNRLETKQMLLKHFHGSYVTISSNKGKDIGGKLLLLSLCMQLGIEPDWIIFLHDKKSLQALNAKTWKSDLLRIIEEDKIEEVEEMILNDQDLGIVATQNYLSKEIREDGKFVGKNGAILSALTDKYGIKPKDYVYVAGTMFWAKASALMDFFRKHDPLVIRQTLEEGNVLDNFKGTQTHSWERMFSWIVLSEGLNIKTV